MKYLFIIGLWISPLICFSQTKDIELANHYVFQEEYDKAFEFYSKLEKNKKNIPAIHQNYFKILLDLEKWEKAEKYIDKVMRWYPKNVNYWVDKGMIYFKKGEDQKTELYYNGLIKKASKSNLFIVLANLLFNNKFYDYALKTYLEAEKKNKNNTTVNFTLQIASLYAATNQKEKMIDRYISYLEENPNNYSYVQNIMQFHLTTEEDRGILRRHLFEKIQKYPNRTEYKELLIWLNMQERNFRGAFIQTRALDKLENQGGERSNKVAEIANANENYEIAVEIYEYLIANYPHSPRYFYYRKNLIENKEKMILRAQVNVEEEIIMNLINDYQKVIDESLDQSIKQQAQKQQAYLYAFYLNKYDLSIDILKDLLTSPISHQLKSEIKILLADIYILMGELWEPTLLYYQVEKENKESTIGHQARFNNAKLSFYRGDFELVKEQLNVLKMATSKKIANDALHLLLLVKDNQDDEEILKSYSKIELLLYQNKEEVAMDSLNYYLKGNIAKQLKEEMLFLKAKINKRQGNFEAALKDLSTIVSEYSYDILADQALFMKGEIYEKERLDINMAMESYQKLISEYPASFFVDEARHRFRRLRGDKL